VFTHETKAKHIDRFDDFANVVDDQDKRSVDRNADGDRLT